jgi:hypothetical protein
MDFASSQRSSQYCSKVARWKLGDGLANEGRAQGYRSDRNLVGSPTKFRAVLERIKFDTHSAQDAQRIACLPPDETFCRIAWARAALTNFAHRRHAGVRPP